MDINDDILWPPGVILVLAPLVVYVGMGWV